MSDINKEMSFLGVVFALTGPIFVSALAFVQNNASCRFLDTFRLGKFASSPQSDTDALIIFGLCSMLIFSVVRFDVTTWKRNGLSLVVKNYLGAESGAAGYVFGFTSARLRLWLCYPILALCWSAILFSLLLCHRN
jgi:hypothetical protein